MTDKDESLISTGREEPFFRPDRLRFCMYYRNITCQELADAVGLSKQAVSKYANGIIKPSKVKMLGLCLYFNVDADFFTKQIITVKFTGTNLKLIP